MAVALVGDVVSYEGDLHLLQIVARRRNKFCPAPLTGHSLQDVANEAVRYYLSPLKPHAPEKNSGRTADLHIDSGLVRAPAHECLKIFSPASSVRVVDSLAACLRPRTYPEASSVQEASLILMVLFVTVKNHASSPGQAVERAQTACLRKLLTAALVVTKSAHCCLAVKNLVSLEASPHVVVQRLYRSVRFHVGDEDAPLSALQAVPQ